jgi:hypothetical protein
MASGRIRIGHGLQVYDAFDDAEDPLGSPWQARVNTLLTDMYATGGKAIAKSVAAGSYDDSAALLSGFGANVDIVATIFKHSGINAAANHECELLLRATQTEELSEQYEALYKFDGTIQCFKWHNDGGQAFLSLTEDSGPLTMGRAFITGDRLRAKIIGNVITMSCIEANDDETVLGVFTDSTYATGQPGIGGFFRVGEGADQTHFCFMDVRVTQLA